MPAYDLLMLLILVCATILGAIKGFRLAGRVDRLDLR